MTELNAEEREILEAFENEELRSFGNKDVEIKSIAPMQLQLSKRTSA